MEKVRRSIAVPDLELGVGVELAAGRFEFCDVSRVGVLAPLVFGALEVGSSALGFGLLKLTISTIILTSASKPNGRPRVNA